MGMLLSTSFGNPWDYLNGKSYAFEINAGNANKVIGGIYNFAHTVIATMAIVMILTALVGMIVASSPKERTQGKEAMMNRFVVLFLLGCVPGFLTLIMTIFNIIFGIQ